MSDNPLNRIQDHDRVSLRAVVVSDGEDPGPALTAAGISDPVALPVVFGEGQPDVSFGDGFTPNLTAVLEPDPAEDDNGSSGGGGGAGKDAYALARDGEDAATGLQADPVAAAMPASEPATVTLPAAYGLRPLAPVRRPA